MGLVPFRLGNLAALGHPARTSGINSVNNVVAMLRASHAARPSTRRSEPRRRPNWSGTVSRSSADQKDSIQSALSRTGNTNA